MVELMNFKEGSNNYKINAAVTNLNVCGLLIPPCGRDKDIEYTRLTG
jgi:hypothetical protein